MVYGKRWWWCWLVEGLETVWSWFALAKFECNVLRAEPCSSLKDSCWFSFDFSLSLKAPGVDLAQVLCTPQVILTREDLPVGCLAECRFDLQRGGGQVDVFPGLWNWLSIDALLQACRNDPIGLTGAYVTISRHCQSSGCVWNHPWLACEERFSTGCASKKQWGYLQKKSRVKASNRHERCQRRKVVTIAFVVETPIKHGWITYSPVCGSSLLAVVLMLSALSS